MTRPVGVAIIRKNDEAQGVNRDHQPDGRAVGRSRRCREVGRATPRIARWARAREFRVLGRLDMGSERWSRENLVAVGERAATNVLVAG